ncbi:MAG: single-stranded-DNA-specific exonuclease RecJ [Verrucomicrobiota bacterium]
MQYRWILAPEGDSSVETALARDLEIPPFLATLLCRRGFQEESEARNFLEPKLNSLLDPFLLPNLRIAAERILAAIDRRERIVLYGDYDVDGVTSLALFTRVLRALGADLQTFLPQRKDEGYGLSPEGIARCVNTHRPQLLLALDCGTSSIHEIELLKSQGIEAIVFDHHEIKSELPDCTLVNPKLGETFHQLCSVGIVFKACHALLKLRPLEKFDLREVLDLVALGTVADIVPLVGENRTLVQKGLRQMEKTRWIGLRALMDIAAVRAPIRPVDVGYRLGPRLNAAGRLGTAEDALRLLLAEDLTEARALAVSLDRQNQERQLVEQRTLREAEKMAAEIFNPERDAAIVVGGDGWHPGVLGIVASRLTRTHHRPCFVIGFDENGVGKGSGRSIEGLSLVHALTQCDSLLEKFGGHEMAAGLTLLRDNFAPFQRAFLDCAGALLSAEDLKPRLHLDTRVALADLDFEFLEQHDLLQPFGTSNHQPAFFANGVAPVSEPRVLKEKHLSLILRQNGCRCQAIYFGGAAHELPRPPWDIAFRIERNEFRDTVSLQVQIIAIRSSEEL